MTGSADKTIKLWDIQQLKKQEPCVQTIIGHEGSVIALKFFKTKNHLISSSSDKTIRIWR